LAFEVRRPFLKVPEKWFALIKFPSANNFALDQKTCPNSIKGSNKQTIRIFHPSKISKFIILILKFRKLTS
jgi:hypothetical protein